MSDMKHQRYEYVTTAGQGTMLSLGVADNFHTVKAYANKDELKSQARGGPHVVLHHAPASDDCQTGQ
ncbi:hypothetical protein [Mesorhizobium sp.]|uniref:hypothetical protein n=1 Tax=Mesorhizobium sp. TaxID=1871066 RepID=UPI000FE758AF|nr:hypothetical protein [Mesorhizobium sp.]RWI35395.1 MAG: hypothetical protein EOR14_28235 [Mesorhizobium sp.]RWJ66436.1 MAG: hypothetical protein EOR34_28900 [Mesorhizobium sp.]